MSRREIVLNIHSMLLSAAIRLTPNSCAFLKFKHLRSVKHFQRYYSKLCTNKLKSRNIFLIYSYMHFYIPVYQLYILQLE